jgi:5-methylthioadenosine/S-adenosylhomocysteine deaminase
MATINGAKALLWDKEIGSIEVGKKADIVIIDIDKPHFYPHHNLISALAYTAQASDVDTVIINGKIIMENREIKTVDVEKVMYNVEKRAKNLIQR